MDKEHYRETLNSFYDTYKEYTQKMIDLTKQIQETEDDAERQRLARLKSDYESWWTDYHDGVIEDNRYNLQYLINSSTNGLGIDISNKTYEEQLKILKELVPFANSTHQTFIDNIDAIGGFTAAIKDFKEELNEAVISYD